MKWSTRMTHPCSLFLYLQYLHPFIPQPALSKYLPACARVVLSPSVCSFAPKILFLLLFLPSLSLKPALHTQPIKLWKHSLFSSTWLSPTVLFSLSYFSPNIGIEWHQCTWCCVRSKHKQQLLLLLLLRLFVLIGRNAPYNRRSVSINVCVCVHVWCMHHCLCRSSVPVRNVTHDVAHTHTWLLWWAVHASDAVAGCACVRVWVSSVGLLCQSNALLMV